MIYILEDSNEIRDLELYTLKNAGYVVQGFSEWQSFADALKQEIPVLIILDIMLPDGSGLDILKTLRANQETAGVPVIMVTAKTTEADVVRGFDYGADDYISKPFSLVELVARVQAVLRRSVQNQTVDDVITLGILTVIPYRRKVLVNGEECSLTYKEFELLAFMAAHPDRVFTRDMLMDQVWGMDYVGESRTVDMHIKTLRQKLGAAGEMLKTVRNVGYKINHEA